MEHANFNSTIYARYIETEVFADAPRISVERLCSLIRGCPSHPPPDKHLRAFGCSGCDEHFFSCISTELTAVTKYFNKKVQWLLQMHLSSVLKKTMLKIRHKQARSIIAMIQEGQRVLKYASMMTLSAHYLLEDYDKVHASSEGSKFKARVLGMHLEPIQSPWLLELLALYFNFKWKNPNSHLPELCAGCSCDVDSENRFRLTCRPNESLHVDIELTCSICLETLFQPMALKCGHVFCYSCACTAASVPIYEGLKKAKEDTKCPLCREANNAFAGAIELSELQLLIFHRFKDECKARLQRERKERMKQIKEHWSYRPEDIGSSPFTFIDY